MRVCRICVQMVVSKYIKTGVLLSLGKAPHVMCSFGFVLSLLAGCYRVLENVSVQQVVKYFES